MFFSPEELDEFALHEKYNWTSIVHDGRIEFLYGERESYITNLSISFSDFFSFLVILPCFEELLYKLLLYSTALSVEVNEYTKEHVDIYLGEYLRNRRGSAR